MSEKAFRLDFFIAIAALLISALTAGALVYQTRVIADQYAAAIWPYLSVDGTFSYNGGKLELENDGLGPALIQSAQLSVDGKVVSDWNDYTGLLAAEPEFRALRLRTPRIEVTRTTASIGPSSTIRPGESRLLAAVSYNAVVDPAVLRRHSIALDFCYCSLNQSCWTLHASPGQDNRSQSPQPVHRCMTDASISSTATSPSSRPRKK